MDDEAEIIVCAGPPECPYMGDEAVENAQAGCPICRHIIIAADGREREERRKRH